MRNGIKIVSLLIICLIVNSSFSQKHTTSGKIEFERKTNLKKKFGDNDSPWMRGDLKKPKIDKFELYFNDTCSLFLPVLSDEREEMSWATTKNKVYQNYNTKKRLQLMSFWGDDLVISDSTKERTWKLTNKKRIIAGYSCRRAIWAVNDSTNIYAYYAEELMSSTGPETFNGLPGVILGLATEDGGVVYFAKDVKIDNFDIAKRIPKVKEKDKKTEAEIKTILYEQFGQREGMDSYFDEMFMW